ncbi:MAG: gliding motility-associated C-terminal domain-containing protein, partial [Bacteroidetes bacterium]|nr:gliding motility-associated C-terminal domain-containing protein [Bacteroidota bacterium]
SYYVSQTTTPCGESVRTPLVVNITALPAAPVTSPLTICQASTAAPLTASGSNLLWYTSATGGTGVSSLAPSTTNVGNTTYYVSQTVSSCEGPRAPLVVTVVSLPPAPVGSGPFTYCQGTPATQLTATGTALLWYTTATGGTGSTVAPVPSTANDGVFTYYVSQTFSCGEGPRTPIVVTVNPTPAAPVTNNISYCQGTPTAALTANGSNLLWYTNETGGTGTAVAPVPSSTAVSSTTYYVSSTLGVCEGPRATLTVTINVTPNEPFVGDPLNYCQNTIVAPLTASGVNLLWYSSPTGGTGSPMAPADYTSYVGTTVYYVSQTIGVCEGPRSAITVNINPYPNLGADQRDTVCFGETVDLTTKYDTTGLTFGWFITGHEITNPQAVGETGVYQLQATNNVGCADTANVYVIIMPKVIPSAGHDTTAIKGVPHQLMASGGVSYSWSPAYLLNTPDVQFPLATLDHDQQFVVTVTDAKGCSATDKVMVKVYNGPTYYVPNAFTPNGDGLNDIFRVVPVGVEYTDWFRIFNRYGQLVFETNEWMKGWDGTFKGKKQPVGSFVWMVKGRDKYGKVVEMKGTVTIVQ